MGVRSRTRHRVPSQSPYGGRIPFRCQPLSYVSCPCRVAAPRLPCWPAGGFFPSKPADQHQMRAPVVCRHDGTLVVPASHRIYLKVSKTLLLIYNRRPQRYVNPVLDNSPGTVQAVTSSLPSTAVPEVTSHLVIAPALLLPNPTIDGLCAYHLFPLRTEPPANLLRTVLAVDDEPSDGSLHIISELQVVSPVFHPPFVFFLSQLPSVPMVSSHVAVPPDLTAHRACTDPDHFSYLPEAHRRLQEPFHSIKVYSQKIVLLLCVSDSPCR